MRFRAVVTTVLLALAAVACRDSGQGNPIERPTLVGVDPKLLPGVACADAPGALRTYVATVADTTTFDEEPAVSSEVCELQCSEFTSEGTFVGRVSTSSGAGGATGAATETAGAAGAAAESNFVSCTTVCDWIALPSSGPVSCTLPVGFAFVVPGHRYVARVDGYDREDLVPIVEGRPELADPQTGAVVAPRWVWLCEDPAIAIRSFSTVARGCTLTTAAGGSQTTEVVVPIAELLGELTCGDATGTVSRVELALDDASTTQSVACDATARFGSTADGSFVDGQTYRIEVSAFELGAAEAFAATTCYAKAHRGVAVTADCDPLAPVDG